MRQAKDTAALPVDVLQELSALYRTLRESLPLARQRLLQGGVDLLSQEAFWSAYRDLSEYGDFDEDDNDSPSGMYATIDEIDQAISAIPVSAGGISPALLNEDISSWVRRHDNTSVGTRALNCLSRSKIVNVDGPAFTVAGDLTKFSKSEVVRIKNMGGVTVNCMANWLHLDGLSFRTSDRHPRVFWDYLR